MNYQWFNGIDLAGMMMNIRHYTAMLALSAAVFSSGAHAADLSYKDAPLEPDGRTWIITIGGYAVAQPEFEGSDDYELGFKPIFGIRREGSREWLTLAEDSGGFALFESGNFRVGPAFNFREERDGGDVDLPGADDVDFTFEAGLFAELWLTDGLRTRVELLQGLGGHEGFVAHFSADAVLRRDRWTFTAGPRLQIVSDEYNDSYFSIGSYDAEGGLHSIGVGASVSYAWSEQISLKLYGEYDKLLNDAADSPIVDLRGSEDQFAVGVGASYKFELRR